MNPDRPPAKSAGLGVAACALFAFVFCSRAWLIKVWGSPVPYWDEWDAHALALIRPWLDGSLRWADLFAPHNEHRIVLTRLADLALFIAGGNWNPWWQLLLNAFLHAATATALCCFCWNEIPGKVQPAWVLGLALLFVSPSGWQNALWGFQSHGYFCGLLSILALSGLLLSQPRQPRWWFGWLAALLALVAVGTGVLAAITALLVNVLVLLFRSNATRKLPTVSSALAPVLIFSLVALGWSLKVNVPPHESLHAHTLAQFSAVFFRCLSWPWVDSSWLWLILQAPLLWLTIHWLRRRSAPNAMEQFILGLGLLAALHAAAVAYSRGAGLLDARPLSRYQDPLLLSVAANFFLLLRFAGQNQWGRLATLVWSGTLLAGLLTLTTTNLSLHLPYKRDRDTASLTQIRAYLTTADATVFTQDPSRATLHPDLTTVQRVLDDPQLRRVLPREFFGARIRRPWLIENSFWITLLCAGGLLLVTLRYRKTPSGPSTR